VTGDTTTLSLQTCWTAPMEPTRVIGSAFGRYSPTPNLALNLGAGAKQDDA